MWNLPVARRTRCKLDEACISEYNERKLKKKKIEESEQRPGGISVSNSTSDSSRGFQSNLGHDNRQISQGSEFESSSSSGFNRGCLDSKHVLESSIGIDDDDVDVKVEEEEEVIDMTVGEDDDVEVKVEEEELEEEEPVEVEEEVIDMTLGEDEEGGSSSDNDSHSDETDYDSDRSDDEDEYFDEEEEEDSEVESIAEEVMEKNKKKRVDKSSEEDSEVEFIEKDVGRVSKNTESLGNGVIDLTGDDDDDMEISSSKGRKGKGVKRKKAFGLDILDCLDAKKSDYLYLKPGSVARRARSHFDPVPSKRKTASRNPLSVDEEGLKSTLGFDSDIQSDDKVKPYERKTKSETGKFGSCSKKESVKHSDPAPSKKKTVSRIGKAPCPLSVDVEGSKPTLGVDHDTRSADNVRNDERKTKSKTEESADAEGLKSTLGFDGDTQSADKVQHNERKTKSKIEEFGSSSKKEFVKRTKRSCKPRALTQKVLKILADSLLDSGETPLDDCSSETKTEILTASEGVLQYKFTFGEEEEEPVPEKTDAEIVVEGLFNVLNFALKCSEIGSADHTMVEDDSSVASHDELDVHSLCCQGKHRLKLDEEIGLFCEFCGHVELEIRYLVAPFVANPRRRTDDRYRNREEISLFDELANQDLGFQSDSGSDCEYGEGTVWDLIPGLKQTMYPHQREGFEFLWNNIAGGICLEKLKDRSMKNAGSGCIISHVPGTGKSRLTLVFLQSCMKLFPNCKPVIVAPKSMLLTWEEEFKKWKVDVPFHNLDSRELSANESAPATALLPKGNKDRNFVRLVKLFSWNKQKSVLGIGYSLFELLAGGEERKSQNYSGVYGCEKIKTLLLDTPNPFIFDEGHTPRTRNLSCSRRCPKSKPRNASFSPARLSRTTSRSCSTRFAW